MTKPDFSSARAKLARARKHISDVEAQIASYLRTDFYEFDIRHEENEGRVELIVKSLHQPDPALNAVIGDAISNLRTVLDYAMNALLRAVTGKTDAGGFPFADDAKGFAGQVRRAVLVPLGNSLEELFIQQLQAYRGGNGHTLWKLNKLRNIDKHRLLVATSEIAAVRLSFVDAMNNRMDNCTVAFPAGQQRTLLSARVGHGITFTRRPEPVFDVQFQEPPYCEGETVLRFLSAAADQTETLLATFEGLFADDPD